MESSKLEMKDFQVPELFTSYVHTLHFIYTSVSFPHPSSFAEVDYFKCSRTWQGTARNKGEKKKKDEFITLPLAFFFVKMYSAFFPCVPVWILFISHVFMSNKQTKTK